MTPRALLVVPAALALLACGAPRDRDDTAAADVTQSGSIPTTFENTCEGEGCQASYAAIACRDVPLVAGPGNRTVIDTVERRDTADVRTDLLLKKPGVVVLKRDFDLADDGQFNAAGRQPALHFAGGDTVWLLSYLGEGYWETVHRGQRMQLPEFWAGPDPLKYGSQDSAQAKVAIGSVPVIETWLRVSRGGQVIGWWLDDRSNALAPIGGYAEKWGLSCSSVTRP